MKIYDNSVKIILTICILLLVLAGGVIYYQNTKINELSENKPAYNLVQDVSTNTSSNVLDTKTSVQVFENNKNITSSEVIPENSQETNARTYSTISGTLSYPGQDIPLMNVCAVNISNKQETCVKNNNEKYSISVLPGEYLVYASPSNFRILYKAYYSECDTYQDQAANAACNPNYFKGGRLSERPSFICVLDAECRSAFMPKIIQVTADARLTLSAIMQGWYMPCESVSKCNGVDSSGDRMQPFLDIIYNENR